MYHFIVVSLDFCNDLQRVGEVTSTPRDLVEELMKPQDVTDAMTLLHAEAEAEGVEVSRGTSDTPKSSMVWQQNPSKDALSDWMSSVYHLTR